MLPDDWRPQGATDVRPHADEAQPRVAADAATIKALEGNVETLKIQVAAEQAKTRKTIEAFSALAQRLEAMAAQHAIKPWWHRLLRSAG